MQTLEPTQPVDDDTRTARWARGLSIAIGLVFVSRFAMLVFDGGEFLRTCSFDCDNANSNLIATTLLVLPYLLPIAAVAAWVGVHEVAAPRWARLWAVVLEHANGAIAFMAMGSALVVPILVPLLIPLAIASFGSALALARALAPPTKTNWRDDPQVTRRSFSYLASGAVVAVHLLIGFVIVKRGGACTVTGSLWHNCTTDGQLLPSLGWLVVWTVPAALIGNALTRRLRPDDHPATGILVSAAGLLFGLVLLTSHMM